MKIDIAISKAKRIAKKVLDGICRKEGKIRVTSIFILFIILSISVSGTYFFYISQKVPISAETDFIYECGLQLKKNGQKIENLLFKDIPIGIAIWSCDNIIANCTFINCPDEGILVLGDNNTIINCLFVECCDGIELQDSSNNSFINCNFIYCYHAGVDGLGFHNYNNQFKNCIFYDSIVWFREMNDNNFTDCWFSDSE